MTRNRLTYLLLTALLLAACSNDDAPAPDPKAYPLVIEGKVYGYDTAEGGTTWTNTENIVGVYVLKGGSSEVVTPYGNLGYCPTPASSDDYFQPVDVAAVPYFPPTGEEVWDVAVYYPYAADADGDLPLVLDQQGTLRATSLLYARATSLSKENRIAGIRLAPALSRIAFYFRAGDGITADLLNNATVDLNGIPTAGTFHVQKGAFTADAASIKSFRMRTASSADATVVRSCEAFVMPSGSTQGYTATIRASQLPELLRQKVYRLSDHIGSLSRGMQYIFDVTISQDGYSVETSSSPIAGWEESDKIGGEGEEMNP